MEQALPPGVRRATPDDAEAVVSIHYQAWLDAYLPIVEGLTEADIKERFHYDDVDGLKEHTATARERLASPETNTQMFLHVSEDIQVTDGFIVAGEKQKGEDKGKKMILALYVDPAAQGKGVGSHLMEAALKYMQADVNEIELGVVSTNQKAISFYEKHGFVYLRDVAESECEKAGNTLIPEIDMIREPAPL